MAIMIMIEVVVVVVVFVAVAVGVVMVVVVVVAGVVTIRIVITLIMRILRVILKINDYSMSNVFFFSNSVIILLKLCYCSINRH